MSEYVSGIGSFIERLFDYRCSLGYSGATHRATLLNLDRFCAANYPEADKLTEQMVLSWLSVDNGDVHERSLAIRLLGKYMCAVGNEAYVLPEKYVSVKHDFAPYIFTDDELRRLFSAIDQIIPTSTEPFAHVIAPVLFRLIYTCGLRPNEGRELRCENVHLETGEVLITNTKKKKERMVVMSEDMRSLMASYRVKRSAFGQENNFWFPSAKGGPISSAFQTKIFKKAWAVANPGIPEKELPAVRVYDLRHRFASAALIRWLDKGDSLRAKLPYLREYMGHSDLRETYAYIHILPENLTRSSAIDWTGFYDLIPEVHYG